VIFGGSKYYANIEVNDHPKAKIYVNGAQIGTGRGMQLLPRDQNLQIRLEEEGCPTQTKTYYKTFRGGNFVLTVLSWGVIGALVDVATGASFKPDHRNQAEVSRLNIKRFMFKVNYDVCEPVEKAGSEEGEFDYAK
jgi:hypothetical protein